MLALKQFRDRAKGVADLLNYASLIGDGLVLGKDGSLLAGFFYRGPDSASASAVRAQLCDGPHQCRPHQARQRLCALGGCRAGFPAAAYPGAAASHFPDPVTLAIDSERRRQFLAEGAHFETEYAFLIAYTPPLRRNQKLADLIYDDDAKPEAESPGDRQIKVFERIFIGPRRRAVRHFALAAHEVLFGCRRHGPHASQRRARYLFALRAYRPSGTLERAALPHVSRRLAFRPGALGGRHPEDRGEFHSCHRHRGFPGRILSLHPCPSRKLGHPLPVFLALHPDGCA